MNRLMRILKKTGKGLATAVLFPITTLMLIPRMCRIKNDERISIIYTNEEERGIPKQDSWYCGNKRMLSEDDNHPEHLRISLYHRISVKYLRNQFHAWRFVKVSYIMFFCTETLFPFLYPYGLYFFSGGTFFSISACLFLPIVHRLAFYGLHYGVTDGNALQETWDQFSYILTYSLKRIFIKNPRTRLDNIVGYAANNLRDYSTLTPHQLAQWGPLNRVHEQMKTKNLLVNKHAKILSDCFPGIKSENIKDIILSYAFSPALVQGFNNFKETGIKLNMSLSNQTSSDPDVNIVRNYDTFRMSDVVLDISENSDNKEEYLVLIDEDHETKAFIPEI